MAHLTQQLQLLHVTKDFQQLVKATSGAPYAAAAVVGMTATAGGSSAAAGSSAGQSAANKEVQSLENLLKVCSHCT